MIRPPPRTLSQSTRTRWSTYSVMLMRTTLGSTSLSRGYGRPRLARADARSVLGGGDHHRIGARIHRGLVVGHEPAHHIGRRASCEVLDDSVGHADKRTQRENEVTAANAADIRVLIRRFLLPTPASATKPRTCNVAQARPRVRRDPPVVVAPGA